MRRLSVVLICGVLLTGACTTSMTVPGDCETVTLGERKLSTEMLIKRVGVAEAEAENLRDGVPFGDRNEEWMELKKLIQPGDEVWFYRHNRTMAGAEGYLLVRECDVVAFVMTTKY